MNLDKAVTAIAEQLIAEAVWDGEHATWLGDDRLPTSDGSQVVYRAVDGDLYGGTAGIGLFLARYAAVSGDGEAARATRGALEHAARWVRRTRPDGSLLSGAGGVGVAVLDAARLLGDDRLAATAARLARGALRRPPAGIDLTCGRAGALLADLHLARGLAGIDDDTAAALNEAADDMAQSLIRDARPGPAGGQCWPSDISADGRSLCGLAHGAAGVALALVEWAAVRERAEPRHGAALRAGADAAAFERSWFSSETGNWPDLRNLTADGSRPDDGLAWPTFWCHGALGVGVARLRQYDMTGEPIYAAEAGMAVEAAVRLMTAMADPASRDFSVCHGLAGAIDLLLDAAHIFRQPELRSIAVDAAGIAVELAADGPWPCGVAEGGENPSLFIGMAGIGTTLLRAAGHEAPSTVLAYAGGVMSTRVIVQLSGPVRADELPQRLDTLRGVVPDARVERVSPRGRAILRLPPGSDAQAAAAALNQAAGVDYAEVDVVDTAQYGPLGGAESE